MKVIKTNYHLLDEETRQIFDLEIGKVYKVKTDTLFLESVILAEVNEKTGILLFEFMDGMFESMNEKFGFMGGSGNAVEVVAEKILCIELIK